MVGSFSDFTGRHPILRARPVSSVAGFADPGRGAEGFSERFLSPVRFRSAAMSTRSQSHALTRFRTPCPEWASHTSPGCKPRESTSQTFPRSEGTPHVSEARTSTPPLPMRCSFRTHSFSRIRFQGVALGWYAMPIQGIVLILRNCQGEALGSRLAPRWAWVVAKCRRWGAQFSF